jgi:hypothetical protein
MPGDKAGKGDSSKMAKMPLDCWSGRGKPLLMRRYRVRGGVNSLFGSSAVNSILIRAYCGNRVDVAVRKMISGGGNVIKLAVAAARA